MQSSFWSEVEEKEEIRKGEREVEDAYGVFWRGEFLFPLDRINSHIFDTPPWLVSLC